MISVGSDKSAAEKSTGPIGRSGRAEHGVHDGGRYYARGRLRWLRKCLDDLGERPVTMLDFGCSGGVTTADYFTQLRIHSLVAVEVSATRDRSSAASLGATEQATFVHVADYRATESIDLAFTHDVIPRMPDRDRAAAAVLVFRSLKSGGLFAFWDRNPWNQRLQLTSTGSSNGHRAFAPADARRLLRGVGFDIVHTTSTFVFPRALSWCQPLEPLLAGLPLGREYMVLARKP